MECVLLVLVGDVLEIIARSEEELHEEDIVDLEFDCDWW